MYNGDPKDVLQFHSKKAQPKWVLQADNWALLTRILAASISLCIMWSTIELGTAIICACLPTYRPLLHSSLLGDWLASAKHSVRGMGDRSTIVLSSSHNGDGDVRSGYNRFIDDANSDKILLNEVAGGTRTESNGARPIPLNAISVERRIEVS